jgi:hypothetical protein
MENNRTYTIMEDDISSWEWTRGDDHTIRVMEDGSEYESFTFWDVPLDKYEAKILIERHLTQEN